MAAACWDRGWYPEGAGHQMAAIIGCADLTPSLRSARVPAVAIDGDSDPLIDPAASRALAEAIPGASLHILPGMGHQLPEALWPAIIDLITSNAARA